MDYYARVLSSVLEAEGLPRPVLEFRFHPIRRWRFDICWPDLMLACEINGGHWNNGRHSRGKGMNNDCEKISEANLAGWTVYQFTTDMVKNGKAFDYLSRALKKEIEPKL